MTKPPEKDSPDDQQLMQAAAGGDRKAFAELVCRHQNALVNFFRRLGVNNDAEDLAQEVFLRLYRYRKRYRPRAGFATFLYLLARQVRIDWVRRQGRRRQAYDEARDEWLVQADGSGAGRARRRQLQAALGRLPEEMRSVVVMSVYQGLKYREISAVLGVPEGTVKSRMYHAVRRLRETMQDED